jgi:hypothetical protein
VKFINKFNFKLFIGRAIQRNKSPNTMAFLILNIEKNISSAEV